MSHYFGLTLKLPFLLSAIWLTQYFAKIDRNSIAMQVYDIPRFLQMDE